MLETKEENQPLLKSQRENPDGDGWTGSRLRASKRWVTVELVFVVALVVVSVNQTLSVEYLQSIITRDRGENESSLNHTECSNNFSDPAYMLRQEIQSETSLWAMYLQLCGFGLSIITTPIISAWSDTAGRKVALFLCCVGILANTVVYLVVAYLDLPRYTLFVGEVLQGLTGNKSLASAVSFAYLADISTQKQRMFRFVVIGSASTFGLAATQIAIGYAVGYFGFVPLFAALSVMTALAVLYVTVPPLLLETRDRRKGESAVHQLAEISGHIFDLFRVKENKRHIRIVLLAIAGLFGNFMVEVAGGTAILLVMAAPICWSTETYGIYVAVTVTSLCLGMLFGGVTLPRCFGEYYTLYICFASFLAYNVITGFATSTVLLFIGSVTGFLRQLPYLVINAIVSKMVTEKEQGVALGIVGSILNLALLGAPLMIGFLFAATVAFLPGLTFFVLAGLTVFPVSLIMTVQCMETQHGKGEKDAVPQASSDSIGAGSYGGVDDAATADSLLSESDKLHQNIHSKK